MAKKKKARRNKKDLSFPVSVSLNHGEHELLKGTASMVGTSHSAIVRHGVRVVSEQVVREANRALRLGCEPDYSRVLERERRN
jgi:hypothetical protein